MALPEPALERVGGYQVLGQAGAGGMGVVYKAFDPALKRTVALKFLAGEITDRERLLREARAASLLDHPNIATVHAAGEADDGRLFIVMGYYEGETLAQKLRHGPLQPQKAVNVACQVARGLEHAHARGVIHRDIKPSNIIFTTDGVAKIVDFGLARHLAPSATTHSDGISGTLAYMSPEQAAGKSLDARSDIWSLGILLYQMLTGRLPFQADSAVSTALAIMNSPPSPLPEVPQPLQLVIYRALSKDPAGRYANCTELLDELQQFTADDNQPTATVDRRELRRRAQFAARALVPQPASRRFLWLAALLVALALLALSQFRGPAVPAPTSASQAKSAADSNPAAYDSYLKGRSYLQRYDKPGNLETAISLLEGTVRADPQFVLGFAALGEAYWQKYRIASDPRWLDQAEAYSRRAAELNDQLPAVHTTLGRVHEGRGQQELALQEFQRALKLDANNADAMQGQASIFGKQERLAQAETLYRTAAALRPDYWGGYHELARFYYAQHRYEEAAGQFRSAIELAPDNASAHANLGATLLAMGRQAEAEAEYRKSLTIVPTYSAFANLGSLYYLQKRFAASAQMTEEALQLNQSDYRLWGNLALAYEWLGQSGKARQAYDQELIRLEQIVRNKPEDARVQAELGRLYAGRNMPAKALPRMQASLVLAPGDKFVLIDAADTYEQLGRRPEAVAVLQTALRQGAVMDDLEADPILRALLSDQRAHRALQRAQRRTPKQP